MSDIMRYYTMLFSCRKIALIIVVDDAILGNEPNICNSSAVQEYNALFLINDIQENKCHIILEVYERN